MDRQNLWNTLAVIDLEGEGLFVKREEDKELKHSSKEESSSPALSERDVLFLLDMDGDGGLCLKELHETASKKEDAKK